MLALSEAFQRGVGGLFQPSGAGPPGAASGGWWSKRPAARGKGFLFSPGWKPATISIRSRCGPRRTSLLTLTGPPEEP